MDVIEVNIGGSIKEFPLGVSLLLYGPVGSGKTSFCTNLSKQFIENKLPIIWICLDESPNNIREKMQYFNIDYKSAEDKNLLKYIDVYSEQVTGKAIHDPAVISCSSILNLNEINMSLRRILDEFKGQGLVIFDSLSTLLLYINSSVCEEFLKVHVNRITSNKYTGIFILQENVHESKIEETFKMMMDGVLEFGLDDGRRRVGVDKLPLGSTSDWIGSSIPIMPNEGGDIYQKPKPRKYMDSGGYLEDVSPGQQSPQQQDIRQPGQQSPQQQDIRQPGQQDIRQPHQGYQQGDETSGSKDIIKMIQPGVIKADTIKLETENINLKLNLEKNINDLLNQQVTLRNQLHGHDEKIFRDNSQLEGLQRKITDISAERSEIQERMSSLKNIIDMKRSELVNVDENLRESKHEYEKQIRIKKELERKYVKISHKKKMLEDKMRDAIGEDVELDIPEFDETLNVTKIRIDEAALKIETMENKRKTIEKESSRLEKEFISTNKNIGQTEETLTNMKKKENKIEKELGLVKEKRAETESTLNEIIEKRQVLEQKLQSMTGTGNNERGV